MTGTQGIAPDGTRLILCGISYKQVISCAGMSQKEAAKRLGVNYSHFNQVVKRYHLGHWFDSTRHRCITRDDIIKAAESGRCQIDTAEDLGISGPYLSQLLSLWGLRHLFPYQRKH